MGKGLRAGWVIATWVLFLAGYAYGQQGSDSGVWHGGTGSWSNAGQWDCLGPDFINAVSPVCASPPNGTKFAIDLTNGGTINVDMNVSVDAVTALTNATLVLNGTSLSVAPGGLVATLASAQLSNGAVINPGLGLVTSNLTMQNSTINGAVSAAGFATPTGTIDISGSTIQKLVFSGSGTLKNSTLGDNSVLEISGPSSVSNTSFNGFVGVDSGGSLTIDNGSKINSILFGAPQDVPVGASVSGSFTLQGGSQLTISGAKLLLGAVLGSSGTMKLNDTSSLSADNELVGDGGDGTFNQSGGTNTISGTLTVGNQFFSNSSYNLGRTGSAGTLTAGNEIIGNAGTGFFGQGFGTQTLNSITGTLTLGAQAGGSGTYVLDQAGNNVAAGDEVVGDAGTGLFSQGDGSDNNVSGTLTLGRSSGGSGTYTLSASGGTVEANTEIVGDGGQGTFNQSGGTNTISGTLTVGNQSQSNSSYTLGRIGSAGTLTAANEVVGDAGTGVFFQGNGSANNISGTLTLGNSIGGSGTYNFSGGSLFATNLLVGNFGTGTFTQTGGTATIPSLTISANSGSGTYDLQAGGTLNASSIQVNSQGTLKLDGGSISYINLELAGGTLSGLVPIVNATSLTGWGVIDAPLFTNNGSATFQGGPTTINGPTINGGIMTVSSQTTFQGNFLNLGEFTNLSVATFGGPVTNAGVFRNFGAANGIPSGVTFVGPFTNNGAYMGDPSMNRFQDLIVNSTGYLTGTAGDVFFIAGNFQNLSTQNTLWDTSPAELEFGGTGTHTFDLAGVNGAGFANNFAWGTLVIDAGNILALGTGSGDALYVNFLQGLDISGNLITNIDGAAGLFIYYNPADNPFLQGNYNLEGGGELIAANGPAPTPEPGTLLLIASGLGSFVARRRWHTNKNASSSH